VAFGELEPAAQARQRIVDVLAQDDAAAVELDLELRALGQAERVADAGAAALAVAVLVPA
jgi:hypothetical protein